MVTDLQFTITTIATGLHTVRIPIKQGTSIPNRDLGMRRRISIADRKANSAITRKRAVRRRITARAARASPTMANSRKKDDRSCTTVSGPPSYELTLTANDSCFAPARSMYMYQAAIPEELSFAKGDILAVLRLQDDGWWEAEIVGKRARPGLVPSNYLVNC